MKRYEFTLGTVMRARRAQESMAKAGLQRANIAAAVAESAAYQSMLHYDQMRAAAGPSFMAQRERAELAAKAAIEARQSLAGAQAEAAAAMERYLATRQAVSVLERLDETRREEHAVAVQREETTLVDDLVTSRHVRRQEHSSRKERR